MKSLSIPLNQLKKVTSLEGVLQRFESWRLSRTKRGQIPEDLWEAAVSLCNRYPLSRVSQELRLNYTDLRKRVKRSRPILFSKEKRSSRNDKATGSAFLDISGIGNPLSMHIPPEYALSTDQMPECSMEIRDRDGLSMKMHCRGEAGVDILELCRIVMDSR